MANRKKPSIKTKSTTNCNSSGKARSNIIANCCSLKRICNGLKYYESLCNDSKSNEIDEFCMKKYVKFLQDYIHLVTKHNHQFFYIGNELISKYKCKPCNVTECVIIDRHYRRRVSDQGQNDRKYTFYADYFDQCHHQIFHLYQLGLRINENDTQNNINSKDSSNSFLDSMFKQTKILIETKRKRHKLKIDRYNEENNKYVIQPQVNAKPQEEKDETFLDAMFRHIQEENIIPSQTLLILKQYIDDNEYDSDIVKYEVEECIENESNYNKCISNIYNIVEKTNFIVAVKSFIHFTQLINKSFSTGFRFIYYKKFSKDTNTIFEDLWDGYSKSELYVTPYYESLKQEILSTGYVHVNLWNQKVIFKGKEYYKTEKVKKMKNYFPQYKLYWGHHLYDMIDKDAKISLKHLYCIILYCDMTDLCTDFSATFRKKHPFESLKSVKQRNSKYYHLAKGLEQAINVYGNSASGEFINPQKSADLIGVETGPFYCGLSVVLNIPSFAVYLKGPISTSKIIEISINFAKRDGMIMQINNTQLSSGLQKFLDCSWISRYAEENERLFMSGHARLKIESIRIIETCQNFESFFEALDILDRLVSGHVLQQTTKKTYSKQDISSKSKNILNALIKHKLNIEPQEDFQKYIIDTFDLYLSKKKQICLQIPQIKKYFGDENKNKIFNFIFPDNDTHLNVLNSQVLELFCNIRRIQIDTTEQHTNKQYKFNMLSFLSVIETGNSSTRYFIEARRKANSTWLTHIITPSLKQAFNNKKWNITLKQSKVAKKNLKHATYSVTDTVIVSRL